MSSSINNVYKNTGAGASSEEEDTSLHISKETYDAFFKEYIESVQQDYEYDEDDEEAAEDRIAIEDEERDTVPSHIVEIQRQMSKEYRAWISMGLTQEDLDTALSSYSAQNAVQKSSSDAGTSEFDDWVKSFESQQDVGAFDPDLFRNLLGELESSKYRQKEWNERSAKAAYKY